MSEHMREAKEENAAAFRDIVGIENTLGTEIMAPQFGGPDASPFEQQRQAHQFITQETRYYVLLALLGHPHHLASLDELEYLVPKNRSTIHEHLTQLQERGIVCQYDNEDNAQNEPVDFWGLTEFGTEILYEYNMLRYVPILRVIQDNLYLTDKIKRHRDAPRPELPEAVSAVFDVEDAPEIDEAFFPENQERVMATTQLFDAPLIEPDPAHDTEDGTDRPINELF